MRVLTFFLISLLIGAVVAPCGDGIIQAGEVCDDGNTDGLDGCSSTCIREPGWDCIIANTPCIERYGDGLIVGEEQCDDGNFLDGDGCTGNSLIEVGWNCTGSPSVCELLIPSNDTKAPTSAPTPIPALPGRTVIVHQLAMPILTFVTSVWRSAVATCVITLESRVDPIEIRANGSTTIVRFYLNDGTSPIPGDDLVGINRLRALGTTDPCWVTNGIVVLDVRLEGGATFQPTPAPTPQPTPPQPTPAPTPDPTPSIGPIECIQGSPEYLDRVLLDHRIRSSLESIVGIQEKLLFQFDSLDQTDVNYATFLRQAEIHALRQNNLNLIACTAAFIRRMDQINARIGDIQNAVGVPEAPLTGYWSAL